MLINHGSIHRNFQATPYSNINQEDLGGVCFFYLMLNKIFFELNAELYLIVLSIKLFVF